jgi:hypothetical protein
VKTEDLIVQLAAELVPVRPVDPLRVRLRSWFAVTLPVVALFVAVAGPRTDVVARLADPAFVIVFALIGAFSVSAAVSALLLSVPNDARSPRVPIVPFLIAGVWGLVLVVPLFSADRGTEPVHLACVAQINAMAIVPAVALLRLVRRGATLDPYRAGVLVFAAALAAGAAGSALICPIDRPAHQTLFHLVPVVAMSALGALAGARWLTRFSL